MSWDILYYGGTSPASYSTTFSAAENPISQSGVWKRNQSNGWTNAKTVNMSGDYVAFGTQTGSGSPDIYDDSYAYIDPAYKIFSADQEVTVTVYKGSPSGTREVEILLRASDDATHVWCYEVLFPHNTAYAPQLVKWLGPRGGGEGTQFTYLAEAGSTYTPANGDTIRARIVGNVVTVWLNSTQVINKNVTTDINSNSIAVYSSGQPGIGFFTNVAADTTYGLTSFSATDV